MSGLPNWRALTLAQCETDIKVGDWVRSYDFEHADDCYIVGCVEADDFVLEGCKRYVIRAFKRIFAGEKRIVPSGMSVFPPVNGTPNSFGGYCNGVRKLDEDGQHFWNEKVADWASDVDWA